MSAVKGDVVSSNDDTSVAEPVSASRARKLAAAAVVAVVFAAAAITIYRERHSFIDTLHQVGFATMLASFVLGLIGVGAAYPLWHEVLNGLGARLPWAAGARVFFVSQLGKYVPGSIWPTVVQMQAGRRYQVARRTMLTAGLLTVLLACCIGLVLACGLLPIYNAHALSHYWWVLLALPFLLALLHPRALTTLLDRAFVVVHRPPLDERLPVRSTLRASGWSLLTWLGYGAHLAVLCAALGAGGFSSFVLCTGAMALAVSLGILFIPSPAGAGIREVVLVLALAPILDSGQALAIVVASRVILIACDLAFALVALASGRLVDEGVGV
jgi:hypothetical protein